MARTKTAEPTAPPALPAPARPKGPFFKPASQVRSFLRVLYYGGSGTQKTLSMLSFPELAVLDTERSTVLYGKRSHEFDVMHAKTISEAEQAIRWLIANPTAYKTFGWDSITPIYDIAREATLKTRKKYHPDMTMSQREWGMLARRWDVIYNLLDVIPMHVVVTARNGLIYGKDGDELIVTGTKAAGDKDTPYVFDFVFETLPEGRCRVVKSRGTDMAREGSIIPTPKWDFFAPLAAELEKGEVLKPISAAEAVEHEIDSMANPETKAEFLAYWREQSVSTQDIGRALREVEPDLVSLVEWTHGRTRADEIVTAWLDRQLATNAQTQTSDSDGPDIHEYAATPEVADE